MKVSPVLVAAFAVALGACGSKDAKGPADVTGAVDQLFSAFSNEQAGVLPQQLTPEAREKLQTQLRQLQAAAKKGEKFEDAQVRGELELHRLEILARRAAAAAGVDKPPDEADLRQAYQEYLSRLPVSELHVAHILVPTEGAAQALVVKLESGANFAALATAESADDSKAQGGDLGWVNLDKLPKEFSEAVRSLEPGHFAKKPAHTRYGWHVIKVLEVRVPAPPSYEAVKPQLEANWRQERYRKFLDGQ